MRLRENALEPLPLTSIQPRGWLLNQLRIQAAGLSGHLDEFWPDVAESQWIGRQAEGWERGPYWLDGVVPLAFLLDDGQLKDKVQHWVDYILSHQQTDGWFGPVKDPTYGYAYDPWPSYILLKALSQYQEATADERVMPAMQRFLRRLDALLDEQPLQSWAKMRWADLVLSIYWLYERTGEDWLLALADKVHAQGYDWRAHFAQFAYTEKQQTWIMEGHGPNHAMAIKVPGVWYRQSDDEGDREAALQNIAILEQYHGQATGIFTCDECLAGTNPSQGTELCAVVEYLFSLEALLASLGEVSLADRLERIAFNALPATFTPDMWAHQYDQQANQVLCAVSEDRIYGTNGPEANIFGLAPNFGCCTANMHQGWPKFASHLWMRTPDDGLAAVAYAPCTVKTRVKDTSVEITVDTTYPFEETVRMHVSVAHPVRFPLYLRIPSWAKHATITIGDQPVAAVEAGTFSRIEREWNAETEIVLRLPMPINLQTRYHGSVAIERGPLVYALKIGETWRQIGGELPHADWEIYPTTPWNYALDVDRAHPENSFVATTRQVGNGPFSPEAAPVQLHVKGRRIPSWTLEHNAAGPLPESPVASTEPVEELTLIPYGCTNLRVTEFPTLG